MIRGERDRERCPACRLFRLRPDEAEITQRITLPAYRGRRIYPFVISKLFELARARGIRSILMLTAHANRASQRGILNTGLKRQPGRLLLLRVGRSFLVLRAFRTGR
jgi:hypothetical protein